MTTLEELLKAIQPDAIDKMEEVAKSSFADKFAKNPYALDGTQVDALNNSPDILEKINKARQEAVPPPVSAAPKPVEGLGTTVGEAKSLAPDVNEIKTNFMLNKNPGVMVGPTKDLGPSAAEMKSSFLNKATSAADSGVDAIGMNEARILNELNASGGKLTLPDLLKFIADSKAAKIAGKGMAAASIPFELASAKENFQKGDNMGGTMNLAGAGSGAAALAGSSAALPLGMASGGYAAGKMVSDVMGGEPPALPPPSDPNAPLKVPQIGPGGIMPPNQESPPVLAEQEPEQKESPSSGKSALMQKIMQLAALKNADRSPSSEPPSEGFTDNTVAALKRAQDEQKAKQSDARFTNAMNLVGSSIAGLGTKGAVLKNTMDEHYKDLAKDDTIVKNHEALTEKEKEDPGSQYSHQYRDFVSPMLKKLGMNPDILKNASAAQISKLMPYTEKMFDVQAKALDRQSAQQSKREEKLKDSQSKELKDTQQLMEQMRGNPAVQQAETAIYNAKKLESLLGDDPNKLSPQQAKLAIMEVSKMATGGVPSQHELDMLNSGALPERFAGLWQQVSNKPKPANAGDFLKQYKDYSDSIKRDAQSTITDRYGRILETRKGKLTPDDYKTLQDNYVNRFKDEQSAGFPKTVINKKTGQQATVSNADELKEANKEGFQ